MIKRFAIDRLKLFAKHYEGENKEVFEMAIEALEKQIPKKPIIEGRRTTFYYVCPICGTPISFGKRCSNNDCGQAIDWSDDND